MIRLHLKKEPGAGSHLLETLGILIVMVIVLSVFRINLVNAYDAAATKARTSSIAMFEQKKNTP
jgi:purine-cytosine permease-like protein